TPYYSTKSNEKIIRMPYYEQIGGSCVSTSAQMLLKYSGVDIELFEILKEIKSSDTDFGLSESLFANNLREFISKEIGFTVNNIPYFGIAHLKWRTLSELDKGHPVILSWGKHAVVVLGYTNNGSEIIIHDPQNISPATNDNGTMYTVRSWDWIRERHKVATEKYLILYPEGTFASSHALSLMCPGNDEQNAMSAGEIAFYVTNPSTLKLISFYQLQIKPSNEKDGYVWINNNTKKQIEYISQDAEILKLKLNAYNGSNNKRDIEIQTAIEEEKDGNPGKKIATNVQKFTINEANLNNASTVRYQFEYKVEDLRDYSISDKDGKQNILIHTTLWEGNSLKDYFIIKAILNIVPKVSSINPATGKGGDTITINGFSFGKNKTTKSKVLIGNKQVEITSWSDKEIKIKLPLDIESGPVVVYTGEKYEYESNKDVLFNTLPKCDGFSEVRGTTPSWSNIDCKWETYERLIQLCIQLKDGKIKNDSNTCYNSYQDVSGSYDQNGNVNFIFTWKSQETNDNYGYIVTGTFTGKFVKGCIFYGTAKGKVRVYNKNPTYCKPYDIEKEFTSPMYDKNYKP
ncbi:MAG: IPT/TIG domain-containing protein, partial [Caldisericia bacterium]|nr:IPT/TIG domain-containing protein [Caldisericia bacterium]